MATAHKLVAEALGLPDSEREELLRALLDSLDAPGEDEGHREAWDAEIDRRVREDDEGAGESVDSAEVFRHVRDEIRRG